MKKKIILISISVALPTLFGCNQNNKVKLLNNINYQINDEINDDNRYVYGTIENIEQLFALDFPFVFYLTNQGCAGCNSFKPIIEEWANEKHPLIVKLDENNIHEINNHFNKIFEIGEEGDKHLITPSVGISKSSNIEFVNYSKYMRTKTAFKNHMNKNFSISNTYFLNENCLDYNFNFNYINLSINLNDDEQKELYNQKLKQNIYNSNKNILITNGLNDISLSNVNNNLITNNLSISSSTTELEINEFIK